MKTQPYENLKCPLCNGPMISRKSSYGVFWGCKAFPECKGTRDNMGRSKDERRLEESNDRDWSKDRNDKEELDTVLRNVAKSSFKKS